MSGLCLSNLNKETTYLLTYLEIEQHLQPPGTTPQDAFAALNSLPDTLKGLFADPDGGRSLQRTSIPLPGFKGPLSREEQESRKDNKRREGKEKGKQGKEGKVWPVGEST